MKTTAVIMAGGCGKRFWPKSRNICPKQFLSLTSDGETMIQKTVNRLISIVDIEDIFIVTNISYKTLVREQLPYILEENILAEPVAKNTAPCIAFAAAVIGRKYDDAIMIVLPSDHLISVENIYLNTLKKAVVAAEEGKNLVTIGITPTYPETGYGYINFGEEKRNVYVVKRFIEKPDLHTAEKYLKSGKYLWNSGIFIWKLSSIMSNIQKFMPNIYEGAVKIGSAFGTSKFDSLLKREFTAFCSESIDFGIIEKASNIYTIPGNFGWNDVGNWLAVEHINDTDDSKNYTNGDVITVNTKCTTICGGKRFIAAVGIKDIIIVDTDDVLLVCSKSTTQDIKNVIEQLKKKGRNDLI